jgi:hypothetical protein
MQPVEPSHAKHRAARFTLDLFSAAYFSNGSLREYEQARSIQQWRVNDLSWRSPSTLSDKRAELAWRLAAHSMYAEQAGLLVSAALVEECPYLPTRLALATAVSDEARHVEAFTRYAQERGGFTSEPSSHVEYLTAYLGSLEDPFQRFFIHTLLEAWAFDEFVLLERIFSGDVLSEIYRHVKMDEARHVSIGMSYLARAADHFRSERSEAEVQRVLEEAEESAVRLSGIEETSFDRFGAMLERDGASIRQWFRTRHRRRLTPLFEPRWLEIPVPEATGQGRERSGGEK